MYFTKIRLIGLSTVDFPIVGAAVNNQYLLKEASGLGPPEVDVSIARTLNAGGYYQGRRPQSREIVLLITLNPDYSVGQTAADLRTTLYGLLSPGETDNITVQILNGSTVIAYTIGYVSKLEIVPFSKDPSVQITIPCLEYYLQAPDILYVDPGAQATPTINNLGTAPAGFHLEIIFTSNVTNWSLSKASGTKMQVNYSFLTGDKLTIDTRPGSRGIWLTRSSVTTNIIGSLTSDSIWYLLHSGNNVFATSSQAFNWADVYYRPQYWGI